MKTTKSKLISSLMILALCVTMFAGSTYAWFTDEVTSAGNKIESGNLDMDLILHTSATESVEITNSSDAIFGPGSIAQNNNMETLWEPGKTQVAYLSIKNNGNLALKYNVTLTAKDDVKNMSDVMYYAITPDAKFGEVTAWDASAAKKAVVGAELVQDYVAMEPGAEHFFALSIHMDEKADNDYQEGSIAFDIKVFATQMTAESDSFNDQYDVDAPELAVGSISELKAFIEAVKEGKISKDTPFTVSESLVIDESETIDGEGITVRRADGYTGTMFTTAEGKALTLSNITLDGGGSAVTATGNLIAAGNNSAITLNSGAVLQNNVGAHAVNLGNRIGATLTLDGGEIINNSSDSGAIWGGGDIIMNSGKISNNSSTGIGGAIRMLSSCNFTMNGGEMNNNKAAGDGGAIWGYGSSTYNFNGGSMSNNESAGTGGAMYTGTYSVINISDDFELCGNKAANSGAIRLTDHTSMNMTGGKVSGNTQNGESNAFNTWNNSISITGGEIDDNFSFVGGLGLTVGAADVDGVISYHLSTNHNTAYLAADFNSFKFTVDETNANFAAFNFKPAAGYTYTEGDEAKLVCMNEGYETYWDVATGTFKLKAK